MSELKLTMPAVALRGMTVMPEMVIHFDVSREKSKYAIEQAMESDQRLFLVAQKDLNVNNPGQEDLYKVGVIAEIKQVIKLPKDILRVLVIGRKRAILESLNIETTYLEAEIVEVENQMESVNLLNKVEERAMIRELKELFVKYGDVNERVKKETVNVIREVKELEKITDLVAANSWFDYEDAQEILEEVDVISRYELVLVKIMEERYIYSVKESLNAKVKERIDKNQRDYFLREQLKLIREELGEDTLISDADEFEDAVNKLKASTEVKDKIKKEIKRFRNIHNNSSESGVIRTYIETMLEMPWNKVTKDSLDIEFAKNVLEEEHYGLEEVKERILEFLAVRALTKKGSSPILCLVGPPGTGKTSVAKSLASAMKKKYIRISLGGVRDEAEIRGHRKTYVGAMPGRIANGIKQAGSKNPLMLLDEIDKVSSDHKGDTFSALLEVLDSEQNYKFRDHYIEAPIDLSDVLFVATANSLQTIPRPLLDRMEIIEIHSYTENEKVHIAKRHLIPKQLKRHGLDENNLKITKQAVEKIARNYTKEAGVRQLERKISGICRKVAREILETKKSKIRITDVNIEKYLGKEKYRYQMKNENNEIGIVRGLAWTSVGGDTLQIEVNVMPGKGKLTLTGKLGDVMKESAATGISYIRSISNQYNVPNDFFDKHDIHVHIPEGAVPKDGPSAGITMALAMLSAVIDKPVRADVAMTGEITLRGRVLPIGGLKEKLLAAKNAGIKTVIIPKDNERDVEDITKEITKELEIILVDHMNKVCETALIK